MSAVVIQKAVKKAHLDLILDGALDRTSKYVIRIRKDFNTACWSHRPPHHIFIGDKVLDNVRRDLLEPISDLDYYIGSYLYHEVGHSRFTEKDLKSLDSFLRYKGLAFRMHNLFEDARIEHLMREATSRPFLWHVYEDLSKVDLNVPLSQYFFLIQNEYSYLDEAGRAALRDQYELDERIIDFYIRTIACKDSWAVVDVMLEWKEIFPQPLEGLMNQLASIGYDGESDLSQSLETQENDAALQQLINESIDINEEESTSAKSPKSEDDHGEPLSEFSSFDYAYDIPSVEIDEVLIRRLQPKLQSLFRGRSVYANTSKPSKRLNIKGLIDDSENIYRRKQVLSKQTKEFNLIIDCSGSMDGDPLSGAAGIVYLFSGLAMQGFVRGKVILSSTSGYQTFNLPMTKEAIVKYFHTHGGEGFFNTFKEVKPLMKSADVNFVITDGNIGNGALDKAKMKAEGVHTFGVYVGDPDYCKLDKWFHRGVARHTLAEVIDELRRQILIKPL